MKKVLILTHARDDSAGMVIHHLQEMGTPFVRFNTEDFHSRVKLIVHMSRSGVCRASYEFSDSILQFEDIGVVWNRRVKDPVLSTSWSHEPDLHEWALEEARNALHLSFTLLQAPVVNPWEANERIKFNKILQMQRAGELGFDVPKTCLSSNLAEIQSFLETTDADVVLKKIRKGILRLNNGKRLILHTTRVSPSQLGQKDIASLRFTPVFLQECLEKKYDIRSIVIGDRVFSFAIHSQESVAGKTDFRTAGLLGENLRHEVIDLGDEVNQRLVRYSRSFGLSFGAIDLVLTQDNHLVFLEDNPNGQWGWLEEVTGVPLSRCFAEYFTTFIARGA